jgi:U6 snRNA-associated Sm-like protein LSm4
MAAEFVTAKIKYLRVPDALLDTVKEEQNRAREAGRSTRGGGPGPRGVSAVVSYHQDVLMPQRTRWHATTRLVDPCFCALYHCSCFVFVGRGAVRGGPIRGGRGRGRGM